jgi:putative transposase
MRKTFKFRIYPNKAQEKLLEKQLWLCRFLWNELLDIRKKYYLWSKKSASKIEMQNLIPEMKLLYPELKTVHSQVLQNINNKLDESFQAFFRRIKNGETAGFPRFKGKNRLSSICYTQSGVSIENGRLVLSKIGSIKIVQHREILGKIKTTTIKKSSTGKWYVCFSCDDIIPHVLPENIFSVGIDVGIENFATFSDGSVIPNPRFFREEETELARAQRKLSLFKEFNLEREKCKKVVARIHERISFKRQNFIHQESRKLVNNFGTICVEDLNIKNMSKAPKPKLDEITNRYLPNGAARKAGLNKSISDVAWGMFTQSLASKAGEAGRKLVKIDPKYTSQICSNCESIVPKKLSVRTHCCDKCNTILHRDHNAAINILRLGIQSLGSTPRSLGL